MNGSQEHPDVSRMVVLFLRLTARLNQTELGRAAGLTQSQVSRLESGPGQLSEEALRRVAAAAGVPWPLVARLRRFVDSFLSALSGEAGSFEEASPRPRSLSAESSLSEELAAAAQRSPGELRREAEREPAGPQETQGRRALAARLAELGPGGDALPRE